MKYLKSIYEIKSNESLDNNRILEEIRSILVELEDEGFDVYLKTPVSRCIYLEIRKTVKGDKEAFQWSDVSEYIERVSDYLSTLGFMRLSGGNGKTESVRRRMQLYSDVLDTETKVFIQFIRS